MKPSEAQTDIEQQRMLDYLCQIIYLVEGNPHPLPNGVTNAVHTYVYTHQEDLRMQFILHSYHYLTKAYYEVEKSCTIL